MSLVLTPEQQAIVDYPLDPLRIAAGAGTGKTTTIVLRLAALIDQGVEPEQALGITFTNKAAEELSINSASVDRHASREVNSRLLISSISPILGN